MRRFLLALCLVFAALPARAGELTVAVGTNFQKTLEALVPGFEAQSGDKVTVVGGSTGKLATQINAGAPYDIFLSADDKATKKVKAVEGSEITYAIGALALYGAEGPEALKGDFKHLAIANPKLSPYGVAAEQAIAKLGLTEAVKDRIVQAETVVQATTMVETGNAELGLVALSLVKGKAGKYWVVPAQDHDPIRQNAVALTGSDAAKAFLAYLQSDAAKAIIEDAGYTAP